MVMGTFLRGYLGLLLLLSHVTQANEITTETVTFAEDPWPPYISVSNEEISGIGVEICKALFKGLNTPFKMQLLPWKRTLSYAKHGLIDGIPVIKKNDERETYLVFSEPYLLARQTFFYSAERSEPIEWQDYSELRPYRIGKQVQSEYGDEFNNAITAYNLQIHEKNQDIEALQMVLHGRLDLFIGNEAVTESIIASNSELKGKFKKTSKSVEESVFYIGIAKISPLAARMNKINATLSEMKKDGSLHRIEQSFLSENRLR